MTPSISPVFGNNPAFSVLHYEVGTGTVSDIATFYLDLLKGGNNPTWSLEYRFSAAYGFNAFNPMYLATLAERIRAQPNIRRTFFGYYAVSGRSPITSTNWPFYSCAETQFTPDYSECVSQLVGGCGD